jgi:MFS family permease
VPHARFPVRAPAFAGGCLTGFGVSWNLTNTGAIAPVLSHHYDVGLVVVGLLTSIAFLAEFVVMIPGGRAIDRFGARRVAMVSLGVCLLGNVLLLVAPGIVAALLLRWLIGFGVGAGFVAGSVWITASDVGRSPLGQGLFGGVSLAGAGLATAIVPALEGTLGWRSSYWTAVAVTAAVVVVAALAPDAARGGPGERTPLLRMLGNPVLMRLGAVHSASFAFSVIAGNWVVTLFTRHLGLSYGAAGTAGGLTLILGIAGRPLGGWAARRFPSHTSALLAGSLVLAAAATAALALTSSVTVACVAAAVLGLAAGAPFGACVDAAVVAFPRTPGEAIGAMNLYAVTTIVVGTPLVGASFSLRGDGRIGFAALAVATVLAVAAVPRRVRSPVPA